MTIHCNLTPADYRAFRGYYMFRYRKVHWYYAVVLTLLLTIVWFSNKPNATLAEKLTGLVGVIIAWLVLLAVFIVGWKVLTRFTGGRFRGSVGPHIFEISGDKFVESNPEGRKEIALAGLRHVGETASHFFVLSNTGTAYVIPKRDLQSYDAVYELRKKVTAGGP